MTVTRGRQPEASVAIPVPLLLDCAVAKAHDQTILLFADITPSIRQSPLPPSVGNLAKALIKCSITSSCTKETRRTKSGMQVRRLDVRLVRGRGKSSATAARSLYLNDSYY